MSYAKKDDRRRRELVQQWGKEAEGASSVWASDESLDPEAHKAARGAVRAPTEAPPSGRRKRRSRE